MTKQAYAARGPEFEELPTTVVTKVPHIMRALARKNADPDRELASAEPLEPTLMSNQGEPTNDDEPQPETLRMPRPLVAQITGPVLKAPPPQITVMTPSQPFLPLLPPPAPAPVPAPAPAPEVRRVEHVIVNAASGWLQFVLGILVAISVATAAYLVFEAWHPQGIRVVSTRTAITTSTRAASSPTRGRAPAKAHGPARGAKPAVGKDATPTPPAEDVNAATILDDGLVALL